MKCTWHLLRLYRDFTESPLFGWENVDFLLFCRLPRDKVRLFLHILGLYVYISIYNLYFYVCNIVIAKDKCLRLIIFASILCFRKTNFNFLLQFFCCDRTFLLNYSKKKSLENNEKTHQKLLSFFYTNSPSYLSLSIISKLYDNHCYARSSGFGL